MELGQKFKLAGHMLSPCQGQGNMVALINFNTLGGLLAFPVILCGQRYSDRCYSVDTLLCIQQMCAIGIIMLANVMPLWQFEWPL